MDQYNSDSRGQTFFLPSVNSNSASSNPKIISDIPASSTSNWRIEKKGTNAWRENGEYKVEVPFQLLADGTIPQYQINQKETLQYNQLQRLNFPNNTVQHSFLPIQSGDIVERQQPNYGSNIVYVKGTNEMNQQQNLETFQEKKLQFTNEKGAPHAYTGIPPTIEMHISQQLRVNCPNSVENNNTTNVVKNRENRKVVKSVQINEPILSRSMESTESFENESSPFSRINSTELKSETTRKNIKVNKKPSIKRNNKIVVKRRPSDVVDNVSSNEEKISSEYDLSDYWSSSLPKTSPINPSEVERQEILSLLYGAPASSIKQAINVEREEEEITGSASSFDPLLNFDTVSEKVDLCFEGGIAKLQVKVRCERVVPIEGSENLFKKSSVIVTRLIDIDLEVTPERRKLLERVMKTSNKDGRGRVTLSTTDTFKLYRTFMGMAEEGEELRNQKIAVDEKVDERTRPKEIDREIDLESNCSDEDELITYQSATNLKGDILY